MNFTMNESALRKQVMVALMMVVPVFAWAQHRNAPAPHPSAPAPHASAPAHNSAPSRPSGPTQHTTPHTTPHTTAPARTNTNTRTTPGSTGHTSTMNTGHANTMNTGHTGTSTIGKTGATTNGRTNTTINGRTNTGTAGKTAGTKTAGTNTAGRTGGTVSKPGATTVGKGVTAGGHGTTTAGRGNVSRTPPGRTVALKKGGSASIRPNGQIRSVNRNGMQINHGLHGGRTIVSTHNGARVVTTGRHGGYVQHSYVTRGGRSYYSRTYYYHGVYRSGVYVGYRYGGYNYYGYYHPYWYHPAFYGWAYNPWPAPVYWGWGWGGAPWYGYYGGYFEPYPVYPTAAFWLTDYLIAANLQAAYAAQAEVNAEAGANATEANNEVASNGPVAAAPSSEAALSPEVKAAIADEVKAQIAASQAEAGKTSSSGGAQPAAAASDQVPPALDPARRTFVVSADLDVVATDGQECALTQGDVLTRLTDTPDADQKVNVSVASSKKTDCAAGKTVAVAVDDLQEMHNHFQEQLEAGMKTLASKQGTGGLPKAPDTGTVASDVPPPAPDKTAGKTLEDQEKAADQTESDVKQEAASSGDGSH